MGVVDSGEVQAFSQPQIIVWSRMLVLSIEEGDFDWVRL